MDNRQAIGYMLLACKEVGLSKEEAKKLYAAMYVEFDLKSEAEAEAEEKGFEWYHDAE